MSTANLSMYRGDTKTLQFTVSNLPSTGLTGYSFWFTAKEQVSDPDASAVVHKVSADFTVSTPGNDTTPGVVTCDILPADTSAAPDYDYVLLYDFQVKDSNGRVTTSAVGTLTIHPDRTRAS